MTSTRHELCRRAGGTEKKPGIHLSVGPISSSCTMGVPLRRRARGRFSAFPQFSAPPIQRVSSRSRAVTSAFAYVLPRGIRAADGGSRVGCVGSPPSKPRHVRAVTSLWMAHAQGVTRRLSLLCGEKLPAGSFHP
eukprot:scaffold24027_cov60-Phaeocystis_antarctica.AAC.4